MAQSAASGLTVNPGNEYFDNSVYNAVKKAEPFPHHPEGIDSKSVFVGLRFTPKGLR